MQHTERHALISIALMAAFADGHQADPERQAIAEWLDTLGEASVPPRLVQDVLLKRVSLEAALGALTDPAHRQLAYEMAVCVCDADATRSAAEAAFLAELKGRLGLEGAAVHAFEREEAALVEATRQASTEAEPAPVPAPVAPAAAANTALDEELDRNILRYAVLNGALELLPQSWASMAIIPLQIKMVYGVGKAYGVELDQGHIREFIAAAGVGLTSQYLEQFGRKLLGGLLGKAAGRTMGRIGGAATGMAFSFATTYALGQLAKRYYAGGRAMSGVVLRETFQGLLGPARQMQAQYLPQIQQKAATLDAGQIMNLVRGR